MSAAQMDERKVVTKAALRDKMTVDHLAETMDEKSVALKAVLRVVLTVEKMATRTAEKMAASLVDGSAEP
jgi:hypothetical protein